MDGRRSGRVPQTGPGWSLVENRGAGRPRGLCVLGQVLSGNRCLLAQACASRHQFPWRSRIAASGSLPAGSPISSKYRCTDDGMQVKLKKCLARNPPEMLHPERERSGVERWVIHDHRQRQIVLAGPVKAFRHHRIDAMGIAGPGDPRSPGPSRLSPPRRCSHPPSGLSSSRCTSDHGRPDPLPPTLVGRSRPSVHTSRQIFIHMSKRKVRSCPVASVIPRASSFMFRGKPNGSQESGEEDRSYRRDCISQAASSGRTTAGLTV